MEYRAHLTTDGFIDGLGNRHLIDPELIEPTSSISGLGDCFAFSDYNKNKQRNEMDWEVSSMHETNDQPMIEEEVITPDQASGKRGQYNTYPEYIKKKFWHDVMEKGHSAYEAAKEYNIKLQTAYTWKRKWNKEVCMQIQGEGEAPKKRGRKPILTEEHKSYLKELVEADATVTMQSMLDGIKATFNNIKVSATTLYRFITKVCNLSIKRISRWSIRRDSDDIKQQRYEWAKEYENKLNFTKNCIFIDEAGFNISMRREYGWSSVGEKAITHVPVTRGLNVSFLGAISAQGCISLKIRQPTKPVTSKKRKLDTGESKSEVVPRGTTANHFYAFVKTVIDQKGSSGELNELKYLVLDNAAIHKRRDLQLLVASSNLELVFLPPYSPCLNAIEKFWAVCKSKVKSSRLEKKEELTPAIQQSTEQVSPQSYQGFCRHAGEYVKACLERQSF